MTSRASPIANAHPPRLRLLGIMPIVILICSMLFVLAYWHDLQDKATQKQQIEFNLQYERLLQSIANQLKANEQVLRGVVGLFDARHDVQLREFRDYVAALNLQELHPGILGVGFSKMIEPQELDNHIKSMRAAGHPSYSVFPNGQRDIYTSIIYLEPFNWRNQRAFGYDMYSEPLRRKAMARARDTHSAALSAKVVLVQETNQDVQAGVLLYVPVYENTDDQTNNQLLGWAYSPLRMKDLMTTLLARDHPNFADRIAIAIYDGPLQTSETLLFETTHSNVAGFKGLQLTRPFEFAGQTWTISAHSLPGFVEKGPSRENIFLAAGLTFSVLLTILARVLVNGHQRTLKTASKLRQFKAIVDSTHDAIISKTLDGTITSWNHGAELIFGYKADEVIGLSINLLVPPELENEESKILARISKGEKVRYIETIRRRKDGQLIDISATLAPTFDDKGKVIGSSIIARDITERKRQDALLKESEERLTLATMHNGVGIWDWNLQTQELIWDDSMFALYHLRREDFSGAVDAWKKSLHPDDLEYANQALQSALANEKPLDTEFRVIWPNGEIHYIKAMAKVFRDQTGQPIRILGTNIDITQRKKAEDTIRTSEEQLRMVLEGAELGYWDWNMVTGQVDRNERWAKILGYNYEEIKHNTQQWADFVHPDDREKAWQSIYDVTCGRSETHKLEYRMLHKEGGFRWILDQAKVMQRNAEGNPIRMSGTHIDITERKQAEIQLQLAANVFRYAREGITITDAEANIIDVNDTFAQITGYDRADVLGQNPRILKSGIHTPEFYAAMWESIRKFGFWSGEIWNRRKSGEVYAELLTISAVLDNQGQTQNYLALFTDITSIKKYQQELERIAHFDPLTELPNRVLLADRLNQAMIQAERRHQSLAVIYLDLDGFKAVNDSKGHQTGDELLILISQRMKEVLREGDTLARIGGDEFIAVLVDLENLNDCEPILDRLLQAAASPIIIGETVLQVSASIGLTFYPKDNVDADLLMRHADQAMYTAKQSGKNRYHLFDVEQDATE